MWGWLVEIVRVGVEVFEWGVQLRRENSTFAERGHSKQPGFQAGQD